MQLQSPSWITWNIFLAVVPVIIGYALGWWSEKWKVWRKHVPWLLWALIWLPLALVWFAFLPNTCYLLTEWRHFLFDPRYSPLHDIGDTNPRTQLSVAKMGLFYLLYSGAGVLCYALSIRPIERMIRRTRVSLPLVAIPFFCLTSLGVYMGLIRRLNSWQLITTPQLIWDVAAHAVTNPSLLKVILIFAALLWLLYEIVDIWFDGFAVRFQHGGKAKGRKEK